MAKWCILLCLFCIFQVSSEWLNYDEITANWMHLKNFSIYLDIFFSSFYLTLSLVYSIHLVLYGAAYSQWSARISRNRTEKRTWKTTEKWCIVVWWWQWWWCWTSIIRLTIPFFNRQFVNGVRVVYKKYTFSMLNKFFM